MPSFRKVLVSGPGLSKDLVGLLNANGIEIAYVPENLGEPWLALLGQVDGYLLGGDEKLDRAAIEAGSSLQVISFVGTGAEAFIDVPTAERRGVTILNTPGVMADAVAEHAIGMVLNCTRNLASHNESVKRSRISVSPSFELCTARAGVVGLGEIGVRVARILREAFGAEVAYFSRTRKPDIETELGISYLPLEKLFEQCRVIVLAATMNEETKNLVGDRLLRTARDLCLINVAGAEMVDPDALRDALVSGTVKSAAMDGYWQEPPPPVESDPYNLLTMSDSQFFITPHVAAKTTTAWPRMMVRAVDNLVRFPWK